MQKKLKDTIRRLKIYISRMHTEKSCSAWSFTAKFRHNIWGEMEQSEWASCFYSHLESSSDAGVSCPCGWDFSLLEMDQDPYILSHISINLTMEHISILLCLMLAVTNIPSLFCLSILTLNKRMMESELYPSLKIEFQEKKWWQTFSNRIPFQQSGW